MAALTRMSIYVPRDKQKERPLERLNAIAKEQDRSLNYMVVIAILDYVKRQERKRKQKQKRK